MAVRLSSGGAGATCGVAIYPDSDGGSSIASFSASCTGSGVISSTSLSFSLVAGDIYRLCYCGSSGTSPTWNVAREIATSGINRTDQLRNAVTTGHGTAANSCSTGVPPSTTGTITAGTAAGTVQTVLE